MWPLDQPVRDVLKLSGHTVVPWATFDVPWYREQYPELVAFVLVDDDQAVLDLYLREGQSLGHSPNCYFDEAWHRLAYPGISDAVHAGQFASAFDAYCRGGHKDRSPHWLYDELYYRARYPDLTDEVLQAGDLINGYDHFLRHGCQELRVGHPMFVASVYLAQFDPADAEAIGNGNPFRHYLGRLDNRSQEITTTFWFDQAWYREHYPAVQAGIASTAWRSALEHYLCNGTPLEFDPLPVFSESWYLERYPELATAIGLRGFRNGYAHFLRFGAREQRSPHPSFDLSWYAAQERVAADIDQRKAPDAFTHWLTIGRREGLLRAPPAEQRVTEAQARALAHQMWDSMLPVFARAPLVFGDPAEPSVSVIPAVSVIMVPSVGLAATLAVLAALRAGFTGDIDLIVIDANPSEELRHLARYVTGATVMRLDLDGGLASARNAALPFARAAAVLFLGGETILAAGALTALLETLSADDSAGVIGGMVLRPHGVIQEAGGIVWRDGALQPYQHGKSPLTAEANFTRHIDFCGSAVMLARQALLETLEGFDAVFAVTAHADADFCLRAQALGHRIAYQPRARATDYALGPEQEAASGPGHTRLVDKHQSYLATRPEQDGRMQVHARFAGPQPARNGSLRVLFIEDMVPLRMIGSGFVRSNDLIATIASLGHRVTVFPMIGNRFNLAAVHADMPPAVEVMHGQSLDGLLDFLKPRLSYFDVIWIARTHNLDRARAAIETIWPDGEPRPRIILDTEAITAIREAGLAGLRQLPFDRDSAIRTEFANASICDYVVAVTEAEAAEARAIGLPNVSVIGHMRALTPALRKFTERQGLLFVGAMHKPDSPNYDSLVWFIDSVLPLIERELGWQTRLTVVGYTGPDVDLGRFQGHPRVTIAGLVADLEPFYDRSRIFIAPTRYAAGTPYKIYEAASHGLPIVGTTLLAGQLGWETEREMLAVPADSVEAMAMAIIRLYRDERLWISLRAGALDKLRQENHAEGYKKNINTILS